MEVQIKYGINVMNAEDEINDFDLDKCLDLQKTIDSALSTFSHLRLVIPKCLRFFEHKYEIVEKNKLDKVNDRIEVLKLKNADIIQKLNIYRRNEKYQFQGHHAL